MAVRSRLVAVVAFVCTLVILAPITGASAAPIVGQATESAPAAAPVVSHLLTNSRENPLGIGGQDPRLSWQLNAERRGVAQTAYQVRVASSPEALAAPDVWDSGKVDSARSVDVAYAGPALRSHTKYHWSVRVWDDTGTASAWSPAAAFETGLLSPEEWTGDWIGADVTGIGPEWTDYTVDVTASDIDQALGVYFRGSDTESAYMWQISESDGSLRPHVKNGGYSVLPAAPFPDGFDFTAAHDYRITVEGQTISFYVDGELLDRRTDSVHTAPGVIGFRTNGAERGLVHDVTVTSADGTVLIDTTFPPGDRTFAAGTVSEGNLLVSGGAEAWYPVADEVPVLRKDFTIADKAVASARIYASAQGIYEMRLNGEQVGDQELAPGWTDYRKRIQYQTYDVTDLVVPGNNGIGAQLADGWFSGKVGMFGGGIYGDQNSVIAQLRIEYADGSVQVVDTDRTWRTTTGPIIGADLLDGERYDARRAEELGTWSRGGYDDSGWVPAVMRTSVTDRLEPQSDQPVRVTQELSATQLPSPSPGTHVYDLGQNMVGHVRVTINGQPGHTVRIRHAEVLNPDGSVYTDNLRTAKATDYYTFAGTEPETYEPSFTFHGFRYVEITGLAEAPDESAITGVVVGTDGDLVSEFSTSSDMVNQLHSNIVWGMRGNFLSIPTDTPARDERLGWTGDINVFARTAVYNMDSQAFLSKWLQDLRDTQRADGAFPGIAPIVPGTFDGGYGPAGWADAGVHVPWTLWQAYGDTQVIDDNYAAMKKYVDYLAADSDGYIRSTGGYLDWLNLDDPTPADVLDTAFVAKSTREFAQMAAAIGRTEDAETYLTRYENIRQAYQDAFIAEDGTVKGDSQTAYILTITNDLVPADRREALTRQFVETIERRDGHLSTGFLGVDGLLPALTEVGRTDIAYQLLQNEDYPSWGYEIGKGATTVWERWNSIMPDGSFGPTSMNSFNHYAYGAAGEWMYRTLAGVSALEPGYQRISLAPRPGNGITSAALSYETRYGTVRTAWEQADNGLTLDVTVPGNTTAELRVPAPNRWAVTEGGRPAEDSAGVRFLRADDSAAYFELGSGTYSFAVDPVLGELGEAMAGTESLRSLVDELIGAGELSEPAQQHVDAHAGKLDREVATAWQSHLSGDRARTAADVHRALSTEANLRRWLANQVEGDRIAAGAAEQIQQELRDIHRHLSAASGSLVHAVATLVPPQEEPRPGDSIRVRVLVENSGKDELTGLTSGMRVPEGWTVAPVGEHVGSIAPGTSVSHEYDVAIPAAEHAGAQQLESTVNYRYQSGAATLPIGAAVVVAPPVEIASVQADPSTAGPGEESVLRTVVRNLTGDTRSGELTVEVPEEWPTPGATAYEVEPGESVTMETALAVPLTVTEGPASMVVAVGPTPAERVSTTLSVAFDNPPTTVHDHIDLGDAASERDHGLTAAPSSGTNVEAGLTRRYTNTTVPGGWFEFDVRVPAGEPFVLRSIETYDQTQFKTYDVLVDGQRVHERAYQRTAGGAGTVTYQFVVDEPELTEDGVVRVRFQDVDGGYDPSVADVWITPATAATR